MATKPLPTPEELRQFLRYEPETGKLFWRAILHPTCGRDRTWNTKYAGKEAFIADTGNGYKAACLRRYRKLYAHRVAWAITHGHWPEAEIDHINGNGSDNRLANLRSASRALNMRNTSAHCDNRSGLKGVVQIRPGGRWASRISVDGKVCHLGLFDTKEAAGLAYREAAKHHFGEFARL